MRTLQSQLIEKGLVKKKPQKQKRKKPKKQPQQTPKKTEYSRREYEEMMDMRKPRYYRAKGGSYRSR